MKTLRWIVLMLFLIGLVLAIAHTLMPAFALSEAAAYLVAAALAGAAVLLAVIVLSLRWRAWIWRQGGTDVQWLWFPEDPPGLPTVRQTRQQRAEQRRHSS